MLSGSSGNSRGLWQEGDAGLAAGAVTAPLSPDEGMAMRVPVPAIVVQSDINDGDLYASHGVRWLLSNRDAVPTWADEHPDAWAQRELLTCYSWPSGEACLVRIP